MLWKCCTQYASKFGKLSSDHRTGIGGFHYSPKERQCKRMFKLPHNCTHLTSQQSNAQNSPSQVSTVHELKNFKMFKLDLEKSEEPEIKLPTSAQSLIKQESSRKTSTSALLTTPKPLTVWITINCGKFFKRWEYQTTLPAFWETCMQVKQQQLEPEMEQWTGSKLGKKYFKTVYFHPAYLTYLQNISCKMWIGWSTSWNQDCWEKYQ